MISRDHIRRIIAFALVLLFSACTTTTTDPAVDVLAEMHLRPETYSDLDVCLQIRLFTDVGMSRLDVDHAIVFVPDWMEGTIAQGPRDEVSECIAREGFYRIGLMNAGLASRDQTIHAIHALLFKSADLNIVENRAISDLTNVAVCEEQLDPSDRLLLIYWYQTKGTSPDYVGADDEIDRMKAELCE